MSDQPAIDLLYTHLWDTHESTTFGVLDADDSARAPGLLYDLLDTVMTEPGGWALDAGCGEGIATTELSRRYRCRALGLDLTHLHLARRLDRVRAVGLPLPVHFGQASINRLPLPDDHFKLVWCRDMLFHVDPVETALAECARVLRPGGVLLLETTFATAHLLPAEREQFAATLAVPPRSIDRATVEAALTAAGLTITTHIDLASELLEHLEAHDGRYGQKLLRLARLLRRPGHYRALLGDDRYRIAVATYRWSLAYLLGKLGMHVYLARKRDPA